MKYQSVWKASKMRLERREKLQTIACALVVLGAFLAYVVASTSEAIVLGVTK